MQVLLFIPESDPHAVSFRHHLEDFRLLTQNIPVKVVSAQTDCPMLNEHDKEPDEPVLMLMYEDLMLVAERCSTFQAIGHFFRQIAAWRTKFLAPVLVK